MKKRTVVLIFAFVCAMSACMLASCSIGGGSHTHIFSDEWTFDDTYHWHSAECAHMSEIQDKMRHIFDSGAETAATYEAEGYITYSCTVCDYKMQVETYPVLEHHYSDTLTHDNGDTHWYACIDEGYENLKKGEEKHVLTETGYDSETGYATYTCVCGYSRQYLRTTILSVPAVSESPKELCV